MFYLFLVLSILWITDLVQTLRLTKERGNNAELNPIARFLLKKNRVDFILFKIIDLAVLGIIMLLVWTNHGRLAESMLVSFIALYAITVVHNRLVQKRVNQ